MENHITTELVERIAKARIDGQAAYYSNLPADERAKVPDFVLLSWDEQTPANQHSVREVVLEQLLAIVPHLLAEGWTPPEKPAEFSEWFKRKADGGDAS